MLNETCWSCDGEGGEHNCGEDTCCCLDPNKITDICNICHGDGTLPINEDDA